MRMAAKAIGRPFTGVRVETLSGRTPDKIKRVAPSQGREFETSPSYPVTMLGRCVTMLSSLLGIALIALPAGIITAGYMNALHELKQKRQ